MAGKTGQMRFSYRDGEFVLLTPEGAPVLGFSSINELRVFARSLLDTADEVERDAHGSMNQQ